MKPLDQRSAPPAGMRVAEFVAMMAALMSLNALALDIMLPALPNIAQEMALQDPNAQQLVLTAYVLSFGLSQLIYGPLSDRYGRRPVMLIGLLIYGVAGLACAFVHTFPLLLAARFIQGIGAGATRVVTMSIVRDCYAGRGMAKIMSLIMMVFMVVPVVAPSMGQVIVLITRWEAIFYVLGLAGLIMALWVGMRLSETLDQHNVHSISPRGILGAYKEAMFTPVTIGYGIATALIFGTLFGFLNSAQQIYVEVFDLGVWFPAVFAIGAVTMSGAAFINSRIVEKYGMRRVSHMALLGFTLSAMLIGLFSELGMMNIVLFTLLMCACLASFGMIASNFNALAMTPVGHIAGTAASFLGSISTIGGAISGFLIGQAYDGTVLPLGLGFAVLGVLSLVVVLITEKGKLFQPVYD